MTYFLSLYQRVFGTATSAKEDHLGGPIDLSDVPYCLGLLADDANPVAGDFSGPHEPGGEDLLPS